MTATEVAACIRAKDLSASEVMEAYLNRIERTNPIVNAIVTLLPEKAMEEARAADERLVRGLPVGPLHGLPVHTRIWYRRRAFAPPSALASSRTTSLRRMP